MGFSITRPALIALFAATSLLPSKGVAQGSPARRATGVLPTDPARYAALPRVRKAPAGVLPDRVELEAPTPGDQGPTQASCTAWSVAYATKSFNERLKRRWSYSLDHLFSPAYLFNSLASGDCGRGIEIPVALTRLQAAGAAPLSIFPYDPDSCSRLPSQGDVLVGSRYSIASFGVVPKDVFQIKLQLMNKTPVIVALNFDRFFPSLANLTDVYHWNGSLDGGFHAMVIVGYDDGRNAFKLINSWGTSWGNGGFIWLGYDDALRAIEELYAVQENPPAPQAAQLAALQFTTTEEVALGPVSRSLTTDDNHCSSNCQGEPTRRNYMMVLPADPGTILKEPRLRCVAGPCNGWLQTHFVQLENDGRRAVASFDTWGTPTTWVLSAQAYRVRRPAPVTSIVRVGDTLELAGNEGSDSTRITATTTDGASVTIVPGQGTSARLSLVGTDRVGSTVYYTYRVLK